MSLASLRPDIGDPSLPRRLRGGAGRRAGPLALGDRPGALPGHIRRSASAGGGSQLWLQADRSGRAPAVRRRAAGGPERVRGDLGADQGLISWAWVNPVSAVALPLLAFALALIAVWIVAERGVVRWIAYLQRIAAIYARGRFSVRPVQAERAPPEIRDLADTLDAMAATIVARDAALKDHLAQKDAMLLEIHHRVKNNLQIISSLLNMQQRALTDPAARAAISDTRQRISALALIYRALYQSPDLRRVDLREFLEELVGQLVTGDAGQRIAARTELACDPVVIDPDRLAPIALFAVEAISNACKHGLAAGRPAQRHLPGPRRPWRADHQRHRAARASRRELGVGVGRTLMTAFARQLRGEATFKANPGRRPDGAAGVPDARGQRAPRRPSRPERLRALSPAAIR